MKRSLRRTMLYFPRSERNIRLRSMQVIIKFALLMSARSRSRTRLRASKVSSQQVLFLKQFVTFSNRPQTDLLFLFPPLSFPP